MLLSRGAPDPDPDPAGYPVNLVDPGRIRPDLRYDLVNTGRIYIIMI